MYLIVHVSPDFGAKNMGSPKLESAGFCEIQRQEDQDIECSRRVAIVLHFIV